MKKEINIFTFLNQIQSKQRKISYNKKIASAYMLTQWFSHDKRLIKKTNDINKYQFLFPDEIIYEYYMSIIPSGDRYIKWIKKKKDDKTKKLINKLKEKYPEISTNECKIILNTSKNVKRR